MARLMTRSGLRECFQLSVHDKRLTFKGFQRLKHFEFFPKRLVLPENRGYTPTLSPPQVTSLLAVNETSVENKTTGTDSVRAFEGNQLGANYPIEDRRAIAQLQQTGGTLLGVFDGHAGHSCAQAISERLFNYIAISLLSQCQLEKYNEHLIQGNNSFDILNQYAFSNDYIYDDMTVQSLYKNSIQKFVTESLSFGDSEGRQPSVKHALTSAFLRFDNDISAEAMPSSGNLHENAINVALSGSCACVAHVKGLDLHVANVGDARAVIGKLGENGNWIAKPMSEDHNVDNEKEVERLKNSHPTSESSFVLKVGRLLGQLIPLRAFGDVRYKWSLNDLKTLVGLLEPSVATQGIIPMNYYTPPYLITDPEIQHCQLQVEDKFLILATDGLWECMSNEEIVTLVGNYMEGKQTQDKFRFEHNMLLGDINKELRKRKTGLANKAIDTNVATHLIRHALGLEHRKVSEMLTLPHHVVRYYRDDITVIVVFFDTEYISHHS